MIKNNKKKLILSTILILGLISTSICYYNSNNFAQEAQIMPKNSVAIDDNYEENDDFWSAYDLTSREQQWLSTIDGIGIQKDYDWYEIYILKDFQHLIVELQFTHASGDLTLYVLDSSDSSINIVTLSASVTDDEYVDYLLPSSGTYYLVVWGDDLGNIYDLRWKTVSTISQKISQEISQKMSRTISLKISHKITHKITQTILETI